MGLGGSEMTMRSAILLALAISAATLAGCAPTVVDPTTAVATDDTVYFVLGVKPDNMGVDVDPGEMRKGSWETGFRFGPPAYYVPTDGEFTVIKGKPGELLGIDAMQTFIKKGVPISSIYSPCDHTLVFSAAGGKVVYVGSMSYWLVKPSGWFAQPFLKSRFDNDFAGAQAYMKAHYPALADRLELGLGHMMPFWSEACVQPR